MKKQKQTITKKVVKNVKKKVVKQKAIKKKFVRKQVEVKEFYSRYYPHSNNLRILISIDEDLILVDRVTHCLYALVRTSEGYQLQIIGV